MEEHFLFYSDEEALCLTLAEAVLQCQCYQTTAYVGVATWQAAVLKGPVAATRLLVRSQRR